MSREYWIDYRFIIKAENQQKAIKKLEKFLPNSTNEIWFTLGNVTKKKE